MTVTEIYCEDPACAACESTVITKDRGDEPDHLILAPVDDLHIRCGD